MIKIRIICNSLYNSYKGFIDCIPRAFDGQGVLIYNDRNVIRKVNQGELTFGIKRYRIPIFINQIAYSVLRPSKARRAYEYGFILKAKGFEVPDPVAYIEEFSGVLLKYSYYVYIYKEGVTHIRKQMSGEIFDTGLYYELGAYVAKLHENGVFPLDLSPGNVLIQRVEGKTVFTLIDYNRMKFIKNIPLEKRFRSFRRLSYNQKVVRLIAKSYAENSNLDENFTSERISYYSKRFFKNKYLENMQ